MTRLENFRYKEQTEKEEKEGAFLPQLKLWVSCLENIMNIKEELILELIISYSAILVGTYSITNVFMLHYGLNKLEALFVIIGCNIFAFVLVYIIFQLGYDWVKNH